MDKIRLTIIIILILMLLSILYVYYLMDYNSYIDFSKLQNIKYPSKRVAVLLSGQIRKGYEGCLWTQIINIIFPLKADIFLCLDNDLDKKDKDNVIKLLNPTKYMWSLDKLDNMDNNGVTDKTTQLMYKRIYKCNKLKQDYELQNKFKYDIVIRLRPDLIIKEKIPLKIIENIQPNTIYYPHVNKYDILTSNPFIGITDQFALGDSHSMDIYSNVHDYIYPTYINLLKNKKLICPASETMLKHYLKLKKIKLVSYYQNFVLCDKRLNYDNLLSSITNWFKKYTYYPLHKCYYQNNHM